MRAGQVPVRRPWLDIKNLKGMGMRRWMMAGLVAMVPSVAFATDPTGLYEVQGNLPSTHESIERGGEYQGTVSVIPNKDVFDLEWDLVIDGEPVQRKGVALPIGDTIAGTFATSEGTPVSIALLMRPDGAYTGRWAAVGGTRLGFEFWKYIGPKTMEEAEKAAGTAGAEK